MSNHCTPSEPPPERRALLLLQAALELARHALTVEHPRLAHLPMPNDPMLPTSELLAELLVGHCDELDAWIERYNDTIDHLLEREHIPF